MCWQLVVGNGFSCRLSGSHRPRHHHEPVIHASFPPLCAFSSSSSSSSYTSWQSLKQPVLKLLIGLGIIVAVVIAVARVRVLLLLPLPFVIGFFVYSRSSIRATFHYRIRPFLRLVIAFSKKALNSIVGFLESCIRVQKQKQEEIEHHGGDDSPFVNQRSKSEQMDLAVAEVRNCIEKLEDAIAREDGSFTRDNTLLSEVKETLHSLKALISEYVAGRDMHGLSSSQFSLAVKDLGRQSSKVLQLLHLAVEAQGNNDSLPIDGFLSKEGEIKEAETREKRHRLQTTSSDKGRTVELPGGNGALNTSWVLHPTVALSDNGQHIEHTMKSKPEIVDRRVRPSEPQDRHTGLSNLPAASPARENAGDGTGLSTRRPSPISADECATIANNSKQNLIESGKESVPQSSTNNDSELVMKLAEEGHQKFGTKQSGSGSFRGTPNTFLERARDANEGSGLEMGDEKHRPIKRAPQSKEASVRNRMESLSANSTFVKESTESMQVIEQMLTSGSGSTKRKSDKLQELMNEGESLFGKGKSGLAGDLEVGEAETLLNRAADKFASAAAIDPSSLEAIGMWGNTLLVHGELKLKLSRELRRVLSYPVGTATPYQGRQSEALTKSKRDAILRTLQFVCEECEQLLVEAGRKYRIALSMNKSDFRALYNWGLALCFRAQLISAEEGQDANEAADRVYLAAIDKFEAMMGLSQKAAPCAMLNWGLVLRDRSRLRPVSSEERINLLQQAKQLLEDAARLHPNEPQIRGALATCVVELEQLEERNRAQSGSGWRPQGGRMVT